MSAASKAASDMSPSEYDDFLRELHVAVFEEQSLWEVPRGSIDKLPNGDVVNLAVTEVGSATPFED